MTCTYRWPENRKAKVRRATYYGEPCWAAGRPGGTYLSYDGWHFDRWEHAMMHALSWYPDKPPAGWTTSAGIEEGK